MVKISNYKCSELVSQKVEFNANNVFARSYTDKNSNCVLYVVYSYGEHFPMYVYDFKSNQWLENGNKYSVSTSKQQTQARPTTDTIKKDTNELKQIIRNSY
tara:strand:- start:2009 stop:2311 length:303 start_codon:yes stop_codon:yes gene_type:complete